MVWLTLWFQHFLCPCLEYCPGHERNRRNDSVMFENSDDHYKDASALFVITFTGEETDDITLQAMEERKELYPL